MKVKKILSMLIAAALMSGIVTINVAAQEQEVYFTDFDGYRADGGTYTSDTLVDLSSPYGSFNGGGTGVTGAIHDEEHGTSMRFSEGDWKNTSIGLPHKCEEKTLISFDFYMNTLGTMRMLSDNGNGFSACFNGTSAKPEINDGTTVELVEDVISLGTWVNVEIYIDYPEDMFIFYVDGVPVGEPHALYGSKKPLSSIQLQKRSGGVMFIDNFTVKEVDSMPHTEPITLSLSAPGGAVTPADDSVRLKFSNSVNSDAIGSESITVYDETAGTKLEGLEFSKITSTGVTIGFGGQLKEDNDYKIVVDPDWIYGNFGQVLAETEISFYTTGGGEEITEQVLFATDFDSQTDSNGKVTNQTFECGVKGYPGFRFMNWGASGPEGNPNAETGYCVADTVDNEHGTSLKMIDTFADTGEFYKSVTASMPLTVLGQNKCVVSLDFYTNKSATNPVAISGDGFDFSLSGTRVKLAGITDGSQSWLDGISKTGEWNTAEIYIDYDEGYVVAYVNGKKIDQKSAVSKAAQQLSNVTINTYCSSAGNNSDWWFDNISISNVKYPLHSRDIELSVSCENNTMEQDSDSVYLKFSDIVKPTYMNSSYIKVEEQLDGETRNISVSLSEATQKQVKITFLENLNPSAKYRIVVDESVEGIAGNKIAKNYVNLYPYSDSLRINNVTFMDYFGNIYDYGTIPAEIKMLECSLNKKATSVSKDGIKLLDAEGNEVPVSVNYISRRNIIKVLPTSMLKGNSSYTLVIDDTVVTDEYRQSFNTAKGNYALGNVLVQGAKVYKDNVNKGSNIKISTDIINTAATSGNYTIFVGEYNNGVLNAFHKRDMTISEDEYSRTDNINIIALSNCDEIKAYVWTVKENGSPMPELK